ncbi:anaphase-promoting complex subunit 6-like [Hylaeus anthracinus]|uniref:anaphase-promoting complex subunit 6-like n=1 Tax=Hylaeus anthracinus TaxID=313031 RepID=UPI0023B97539|nr:anaphase-promoting complex subunit 6-like [Hylaeus anthracinus]
MNKRNKSTMKHSIRHQNKNIDNTEDAPVEKIVKVNIGNESPQYSSDSHFSGHSTPIHKKIYANNIEDSPELNYHYSPISLPCTQDGGNEIAWDWQSSGAKHSNDKTKSESNLIETPKRTKQLQKKRNSNSPLLHKPLKRKQVKMENIENIGKLTAELKALSERMKNMQQNSKDHTSARVENEECKDQSVLLIDLLVEEKDNEMSEVNANNDKVKIDDIITVNNNKKDSNYEDLFDDSIDDSMVKCTQEIEEKLNLCKNEGDNVMESVAVIKEKEYSSTSENEIRCLTTSNSSTGSFMNSKSTLSVNTSSCLKTYSYNSGKSNSTSSVLSSSGKDTSFRKPNFNDSFTNAQNRKRTLEKKDMLEFPDDSFDDCLATCLEDDKEISKLSEYNFNCSNTNCNSDNSRKVSKKTTSSTMDFSHKSKSSRSENSKFFISDDLVEDIEAKDYKEQIQKSFAGKSALESRKFFKTKSLSDQYIYHNKICNANNKKGKTVLPPQKKFSSNLISSSVRTNFPTVKNQSLHEHNNVTTTESAREFNRFEEKERGNCNIKYKSTSNLCNIKEVAKESQSVQCTPEEIERKRLEAKMKLEAKRKLQQNTRLTQSEVLVKKSVER